MIVLDASVVLEIVLGSVEARKAVDRIEALAGPVHAPHLLDIEVSHVLRRIERERRVEVARIEGARRAFAAMPIVRHGHGALLPRIWELRTVLTAYDASYVALAEGLSARLLTRDRRLAKAAGLRAVVEVV